MRSGIFAGTKWALVALGLSLAVTGCTKKKYADGPRTCARFGDAAGRCAYGAIEGTVVLAGGGEAAIRIRALGTDRAVEADGSGTFALEKLKPGDWFLAIEANGWLPETVQVTVGLEKATILETVTLQEAPIVHVLEGRILLDGGDSHENTMVSLDGTGLATFTAADGTFRFDRITPSVYTLSARHPGFLVAEQEVLVEAGAASTDVGTLELIAIPWPGTVMGRVGTPEGDPIPGVAVALAGFELGGMTDEAGDFLIEGVPAGTYELVAAAAGRQGVSLPGVVVSSGKVTRAADLVMGAAMETGSLQGFARRHLESDTGGISVSVMDGDQVVAVATTAVDGSWVLAGLEVGIRSLVFRTWGFPELTIPGVLVAPGDNLAPEALLRRSTRLSPMAGPGAVGTFGRKAIYHPGHEGTWLWNSDSGMKKRLLPMMAPAISFDASEQFATLAVAYGFPSWGMDMQLVRASLDEGRVDEAFPYAARLLGVGAGMTFFFDEEGDLYALRASETQATRLPIDVQEAWPDHTDDRFVMIGAYLVGGDFAYFITDGDWVSPPFDSPLSFRSELDLAGVLVFAGEQLLWVDAANRRSWPVSDGDVSIIEYGERTITFFETVDLARSTVRFKRVDLSTGAVEIVTPELEWPPVFYRPDWMLAFLPDEGISWIALDGSLRAEPLCAGFSGLFPLEDAIGCYDGDLVPGEIRAADGNGVHLLSSEVEELMSFGDGLVAWTVGGALDEVFYGTGGGLTGTLPCPSWEVAAAALFGQTLVGTCLDGTHFVDLVSGDDLFVPGTSDCAANPQATSALCRWTDEATTVDLLAVDLATGETTTLGPWAPPEFPITWSSDGRRAQMSLNLQGRQVWFGPGAPTMETCALGYRPTPIAIGAGGFGLWRTDAGDAAGCSGGIIAPWLSGPFQGATPISQTGWWWLDGPDVMVHLDRGSGSVLSARYVDHVESADGSRAFILDETDGLTYVDDEFLDQVIGGGAEYPLGLSTKGIAISNGEALLFDLDSPVAQTSTLVAEHVTHYWWDWVDEARGLLFFSTLPSGETHLAYANPEAGIVSTIAGNGFAVEDFSEIGLDGGVVHFGADEGGQWGYFRVSAVTGERQRLLSDGGPVYWLRPVEFGTFLEQNDRTFFENGGGAILVHDQRASLSGFGPRGVLFDGYGDPGYGTFWMGIP